SGSAMARLRALRTSWLDLSATVPSLGWWCILLRSSIIRSCKIDARSGKFVSPLPSVRYHLTTAVSILLKKDADRPRPCFGRVREITLYKEREVLMQLRRLLTLPLLAACLCAAVATRIGWAE